MTTDTTTPPVDLAALRKALAAAPVDWNQELHVLRFVRSQVPALLAENERLLSRIANAETAHVWELERANRAEAVADKLRETIWKGSAENDELRAAHAQTATALAAERDTVRQLLTDAYEMLDGYVSEGSMMVLYDGEGNMTTAADVMQRLAAPAAALALLPPGMVAAAPGDGA